MGSAEDGTDDAGFAAFPGGAIPLSCVPLITPPALDDNDGRCSAGSTPVPGVIVGGEEGDMVGGKFIPGVMGDVGGKFIPGVIGVVGGTTMPPAGGV